MQFEKSVFSPALWTVLGLAVLGTAQAAFIQIPLPNTTYTSGTTLVPPGTQDVPVTSLSSGGFTVSFTGATAVIPRAPVPVGWQTWAAPPFTETATPRVDEIQTPLVPANQTVTLSFNTPVQTFGFEAEIDSFSAHTLTVNFLNGAISVGTIVQAYPTGISSARLIAGTTPDQQFTSISINGDTDFAIAQIRFAPGAPPAVPEPSTILLSAGGLVAVLLARRRVRA